MGVRPKLSGISVGDSARRVHWSIVQRFDLMRELVVRDIKVKYQRSLLGIAWSLVLPLTQFLVMSFLFGLVLGVRVARYPSFMFCGILVWTWFAQALAQGAGAVTDSRDLVRRPGFSAAVLPIVTTTTALINFLLALPVLLLVLVLDGSQLNLTLIILPVLIVVQFALTLSVCYVLAALNVLFRDVQHLLGIALTVLFYLTPVFYDPETIPAKYRPFYQWYPLARLLDGYRAILLHGVAPSLWSVLALAGLGLALLPLSYVLFARMSAQFAEQL